MPFVEVAAPPLTRADFRGKGYGYDPFTKNSCQAIMVSGASMVVSVPVEGVSQWALLADLDDLARVQSDGETQTLRYACEVAQAAGFGDAGLLEGGGVQRLIEMASWAVSNAQAARDVNKARRQAVYSASVLLELGLKRYSALMCTGAFPLVMRRDAFLGETEFYSPYNESVVDVVRGMAGSSARWRNWAPTQKTQFSHWVIPDAGIAALESAIESHYVGAMMLKDGRVYEVRAAQNARRTSGTGSAAIGGSGHTLSSLGRAVDNARELMRTGRYVSRAEAERQEARRRTESRAASQAASSMGAAEEATRRRATSAGRQPGRAEVDMARIVDSVANEVSGIGRGEQVRQPSWDDGADAACSVPLDKVLDVGESATHLGQHAFDGHSWDLFWRESKGMYVAAYMRPHGEPAVRTVVGEPQNYAQEPLRVASYRKSRNLGRPISISKKASRSDGKKAQFANLDLCDDVESKVVGGAADDAKAKLNRFKNLEFD